MMNSFSKLMNKNIPWFYYGSRSYGTFRILYFGPDVKINSFHTISFPLFERGHLLSIAELECPVPDGIPNGTINSTGRTFASTSSYSCSIGYQLVGPAKRTCQADGKWSGETPTCLSSSSKSFLFLFPTAEF